MRTHAVNFARNSKGWKRACPIECTSQKVARQAIIDGLLPILGDFVSTTCQQDYRQNPGWAFHCPRQQSYQFKLSIMKNSSPYHNLRSNPPWVISFEVLIRSQLKIERWLLWWSSQGDKRSTAQSSALYKRHYLSLTEYRYEQFVWPHKTRPTANGKNPSARS